MAVECFPFRIILKKDAEWKWSQNHEKAFKRINNQVKKLVELTHFKTICPVTNHMRCKQTRVRCEIIQQNEENSWEPIAYASRFLTDSEAKYSINELE